MVSMFVGDSSDWIAVSLALLAMANAFCLLENRLFCTGNSEKPMVLRVNDQAIVSTRWYTDPPITLAARVVPVGVGAGRRVVGRGSRGRRCGGSG